MGLGPIAICIAGPESKFGFEMDHKKRVWASLERVTGGLVKARVGERGVI